AQPEMTVVEPRLPAGGDKCAHLWTSKASLARRQAGELQVLVADPAEPPQLGPRHVQARERSPDRCTCDDVVQEDRDGSGARAGIALRGRIMPESIPICTTLPVRNGTFRHVSAIDLKSLLAGAGDEHDRWASTIN